MYKNSLSAITLNLTSLGGLITLLSTLVISIPSMTSPASALSCQFGPAGCSKDGQYGGGGFGSGSNGVFGGGSIAPSGPGKPTRETPEKPGASPTPPVNPPTSSTNPSTKPQKDPSVCSRKPYLPQC
jgi:hypothetical protein